MSLFWVLVVHLFFIIFVSFIYLFSFPYFFVEVD
jgi:hypothetical protein